MQNSDNIEPVHDEPAAGGVRRKPLFILVEVLLIGALFIIIGRLVLSNWEQISEHSWDVDIALLSLSVAALVASLFFLILTWNVLLRVLNMRIPLVKSARIWSLSQLGRYLPGYIWQFVGRIAFLADEGYSKKRALLSSYIESSIGVVTGVLTALIAMYLGKGGYEGIDLTLLILAIPLCIALLHPKVLERILNRAFTLLKRDTVTVDYRFSGILAVIACFMVYWSLKSFAFFLFIKSIYPVDASLFFDITFALSASWVIGFLTVFAPAGIGVREGLLILLLNLALPEFISPVISIGSRLWFIAGELLCLSIILLAYQAFFKGETE